MKIARIGFDLGGTYMKSAIISTEGEMVYKAETKTLGHEPKENVIRRIKDIIFSCISNAKNLGYEIKSIGIGCPGQIDPDNGIVRMSPNLPDWKDVPISEIISQEFNIPVAIDNDVRVAARGEHKFGAGKGYKDILCITVGTGIGGGIILNNQLMRGSTQTMGEVGHITLQKDGPLCGCGNYGCLETLASATAMVRDARELIEKKPTTKLKKYVHNGHDLNVLLISTLAKEGDEDCLNIITKAGEWIGIGLSSIINILNPEIVIIGGGASLIGDLLFDPIKEEIGKRALKIPRELVKIVPTELGYNSGIIGASTLIE